MRLTKHAHACVRIEHGGTTVVTDPGMFSTPADVDGVDAVLITHEHPDHYLADLLKHTDAPIYTIDAVAKAIHGDAPEVSERVTVVEPDERWGIGEISVVAVGELHAVIHEDLPRFHNSGYLMTLGDITVYHPGDALTVPEHRVHLHEEQDKVDVLLAPVCAPWMRISEGIDFAREIGARHNVAIHDRVYSEMGLGVVDAQFGRLLEASGQDFVRLGDGEDLPDS
ncbi:MAG: MBL fold metallo-hydrolase [Nocardioidaceae bacterium]|nr:MBL fold metallo-hydrolase [Nocardioidaceae bacterium]MCL2613572.1 MBL fold metallo-hydrolase [Nocardioidaceae bacterium]